VESLSPQMGRAEGRWLFGKDPDGYEAGRPDYPEAVYETLARRCGMVSGSRVLEIGPGTGLVTRRLLAEGARVLVVEPDASMAAYLKTVTTGRDIEVMVSPLEDAEIAEEAFDLAVAATSFHWVDQQVGLTKLGLAVRAGGWVALWWTLFRDPHHADAFSEAIEHLLGPATRGAFDEPGRPPFQLDESYRRRDLIRWANLVDVKSDLITWTYELTPAQARTLYASMATVIRRPVAEQQTLLDGVERIAADEFGGRVERRFVTALYTGRRP
jgi:SAM-dependent methyltransferase